MSSRSNWAGEDRGSDGVVLDLIFQVLEAIRGSFMYFLIAIGVAMFVTAGLGPVVPGIPVAGEFAGLMGLWGACLIIYGVLGRIVMRFIGFL